MSSTDTVIAKSTDTPRAAWPAWCAVGTLWLLCLLALLPDPANNELSVPLTFFVLMIAAFTICWTPLLAKLREHSDAAAFCVTLCMFIIYGMARRVEWGISLHIGSGGDYPITPTTVLIFIGAVLSAPAWFREFHSWANAIITALLALAVLGFSSFWLLDQHFFDASAIVNPAPLLSLAMNLVEFLLLMLVCLGACARDNVQKVLLRSLPILLLILWGRYTFIHLALGGGGG